MMAYHPDPTQQMPLMIDLRPIVRVPKSQRLPIEQRFEEFHRLNVHVAEIIRQLALQMWRRGAKHGSMKMIFEICRWQYALQTQGSDWKLDNSLTAPYARYIMDTTPALQGFFETRQLKSR